MTFQFMPWALLLVLGAVMSIVLAAASWRRRRAPGGQTFFLLMLSLSGWLIDAILEMILVPIPWKIFFSQLSYVAVSSTPLLLMLFAYEYGEFPVRFPAAFRVILWIPGVVVSVLAFTNSLHHLVWPTITPLPGEKLMVLVYAHGPAVWFILGYSFTLILAGTVFLFSLTRRGQRRMIGRQALSIILGAIFPWVANLVYLFGLGPKGVDLTPFGFILSAYFLSRSFFRFRLLEITPVAYGSIFDYMTDGVIVFDIHYRLTDANPAAGRLFNVSKKNAGESLDNILEPWPDFRDRVGMLQSSAGTRSLKIPRGAEWLETRFFDLYDKEGVVHGHFLIVRDVTEAKRVEEERAASLERIQAQRKLLHAMSLSRASAEGDFPKAVREITEMIGAGLGTERASFWLGSAKEGMIRCLDLYEFSTRHHSPGPVLMADQYPRYFEALSRDRVIDASDAAADPRTREFKDNYFRTLGITSLLDAPVRVAGEMIGIVSCEQVGPPRRWKEDEIRFVAEIADAASHAYANWERRKIEDARRESEERFRMLVEAAPEAIFVEAEGVFTYLNAAALRFFGIATAEQILGRPVLDRIHPDHRGQVQEYLRILEEEKREISLWEEIYLRFDGTPVLSEASAVPIRYRDLDAGLVFVRDITERKQAEEALKASCQEKIVLLREIQNRVRNNMQIVLSLLNHQAGAVADPVLRRAFVASRDRIKAISMVQEKLYRSEDLSRIDFADYVQSLTVHLFNTYKVDPNQIRFGFDLCPAFLDINLSIPLGIIINEIILNSLRYAFPGDREGEVFIRLAKNSEGGYTLEVRDNGVGIPARVDLARATTLGFQLIGMLVEQISGRVAVETRGGVSFVIAFPDRLRSGFPAE